MAFTSTADATCLSLVALILTVCFRWLALVLWNRWTSLTVTADMVSYYIPPPDFEYPRFEAAPDFIMQSCKPRQYRPFRWGPNYYVTMGLRQGDWADWIELDNLYPRFHNIKTRRLITRRDRCVRTMPGNAVEAAKEVLYELAEFMCRRYPSVYHVERHPPRLGDYGWYCEGQIRLLHVVPLQVTYDLDKEDSMSIAGLLVQDDLAVLLPGQDDKFYLQAGSILLAGSWRLEDKIGLPLAAIHNSAGVPRYPEKLELSMDRFFSKLQPEKLVVRNNYSFQVVADPPDSENPLQDIDPIELHWSTTDFGAEDGFVHGGYTDISSGRHKPSRPDQIYFRSERQSLRRMPRTGAILFTIRTYYEPVTKLALEPGVPGRLASAIRSWPDDVAVYKGQARYKDVLKYLDRMHEEQVANGRDQCPTKYPY